MSETFPQYLTTTNPRRENTNGIFPCSLFGWNLETVWFKIKYYCRTSKAQTKQSTNSRMLNAAAASAHQPTTASPYPILTSPFPPTTAVLFQTSPAVSVTALQTSNKPDTASRAQVSLSKQFAIPSWAILIVGILLSISRRAWGAGLLVEQS